jgi:hypothetical protein
MRKAVARAVLVAAVSTVFITPMAGSAQAATAVPAAHGTTVSKAHPCDLSPWHPGCRHWQRDDRDVDIDLIHVL